MANKKTNLIWDSDINCENDFRSKLLGKPIYDMKCNQCLEFIEALHEPTDCTINYCPKCGNKIIENV